MVVSEANGQKGQQEGEAEFFDCDVLADASWTSLRDNSEVDSFWRDEKRENKERKTA